MTDQENMKAAVPDAARRYMRYLLIMAGLGGLLYGVDVGVIAAALPYIEQTAGFNPSQLSQVVAAVLFGSVLSSLFAGYLADKLGRKALITVAAALFTVSIPVICLSQEVFGIMLLGRILQGASAGIVGVVVPLYLAECLSAESRGKGTGMFQFLLTVGLVFAAVVGLLAASYVGGVENSGASEETLTSAKIFAWQAIFWVCAVPGLFLFFGSFRLSESPRYLFRRGRKDEAMAVLVRSYGDVRAKEVFDEMVHIEEEEKQKAEELKKQSSSGESLLQRKYVYPFVLAVLVLAFTQATGINSVLNYSVKVFQQAGLEGTTANWADFTIKVVNCLMTIVAMRLVDALRDRVQEKGLKTGEQAADALRDIIADEMRPEAEMALDGHPAVILVIGVNGVGKTTSIAKLADYYTRQGKKVMLAAGDTFRAAASEQLEIWAGRAGVPIVKAGEGADPAAVIFDTVKSATARGYDMVIADTAGRLHNKSNLMSELSKISRSVRKAAPEASLETLLVLDAITGQNAISQAKEFCKAADATGIILTKLDGTAKGGCVVAVKQRLGLPVRFIGVGEGIDDLIPFTPEGFVEELIPRTGWKH